MCTNVAINWFRNSTMIVYPSKFQSIIIDHSKTNYDSQALNIDLNKIKSLNSVTLLSFETDSQLNLKNKFFAVRGQGN